MKFDNYEIHYIIFFLLIIFLFFLNKNLITNLRECLKYFGLIKYQTKIFNFKNKIINSIF